MAGCTTSHLQLLNMLNTGATESQTMKTSNVAENHLSLSPVMPSGVDRGIEYPHPVVGVGSSSPHNIKLENGYYSDDVVASDPLTGTYQYFDTYAIDAGGDSLYGRREAEQNLLLWLVSHFHLPPADRSE